METFPWSSVVSSWACMFTFTIICLSSMIHTSEAQPKTDAAEVTTLNTIFTNWGIFEIWNKSTDPCIGTGITENIVCNCSYNNGTLCHITELTLDSVAGTIPKELQNLPELTKLDLSGSSFTGPLPSFIGNFTKLSSLNLLSTRLSGAVPKELVNLQNLKYLNLGMNTFSGSIPKELGNFQNLDFLNLGTNSLSGTIPKELGNLRNLTSLFLDNNELFGTIPKELGNLQNLVTWYCYSNSLTGAIPKELGNLTNLENLYLHYNSLSGAIPKELGNLQKLYSLVLTSNKLSETIPKELGNLQKLKWLYLSHNSLSGGIPKELGNLNLERLALSNNSLNGIIPKELGNLRNLVQLYLSINSFNGPLPSSFGNLTNMQILYINSAGLSGEIPSTLANLTHMLELRASDNSFIGKFPEFIGTWTNMTSLSLQGNAFQGPIPLSFARLTSLEDLRIGELYNVSSSLEFTRNMIHLKTLILRNCMITDSLPSYITSIPNLEHLDLSFNNISGSIPKSLFNLNFLKYIFLGNNNLYGTLPSSKGSNLTVIDLSYNSFSGNLPSWASYDNNDLQLNLVANNFTKDDLKSSQKYTNLYCIQRGFPCNRDSPKYSSFAVNSGGPVVNSSGQAVELPENIVFEEDDKELGAASFYVSNDKRWAVSSTGIYLNKKKADYIIKSSSENCYKPNSDISNDIRILLMDVRVSAGSLRYYALNLVNGNYSVKLRSVQLDATCDSTGKSLERHVFDIYIQGELKEKDFEIKNGQNSSDVNKQFKGIQVTKNILEIHLFWAGKGMGDFYGPSIAAVSANLEAVEPVKASESAPKRRNHSIIIVVSVTCGLVILLAILIALVLRRKMSSSNDEELRQITFRTHTFSYTELRRATNGFDPRNKLGEGGFGAVYKGVLSDGRAVAVKQLSLKSHQGKIQFVTEIDMISAVQHRNLVKLYGCCIEGLNRLLVYEYMENKSLDQALFGKNDLHLSWKTRFEICVGTGRGLAYLHEESRPKIVHRDVKASNILLDAELKPKLSDFGLAKLYDDSITHISTNVAGTFGYVAPEYALKGRLTEKADVFGFGIALLEILSGRRNYNSNLSTEQVYLLEWAWLLHENSRQLELIDPRLEDFNKEEAIRVFTVGLLCTQFSPTHRPSMSRVVSMLLGDAELTPISSKPGYLNDLNMVGFEGSQTIPSIPTTVSSRY